MAQELEPNCFSLAAQCYAEISNPEAGLGSQDVIAEVMGRPAGDVGLIEFREMMKTEGNRVTLGVDRSGKKRTVTLTLRRQI